MSTFGLISFYAGRLLRSGTPETSTIRPVMTISVTGIVLGVTAMLLSTMVVGGFRHEIETKVTGFVADYKISAFSNNTSYEEEPVRLPDQKLGYLRSIEGVRHIQETAQKAALMKTASEIQGIVMKGMGTDFDTTFFHGRLKSGRFPLLKSEEGAMEVLISEQLSKKLKVKTGDSFLVFFIREERKVRKVKISGVYNTGLAEEFDNLYVICDIRLIRQINGWKDGESGAYEVFLKPDAHQSDVFDQLYSAIGFELNLQSAAERYPQLYNWLELQNLNVAVIIGLISLVAIITMISTLLILVMENSRAIGILKSIGATDRLIGRIFGFVAFQILARGLLLGNIIALLLALFQSQTHFFTLPEESYYISAIPIHFTLSGWLAVNSIVFFCGLLIMLIPARITAGIKPVKVLRFD